MAQYIVTVSSGSLHAVAPKVFSKLTDVKKYLADDLIKSYKGSDIEGILEEELGYLDNTFNDPDFIDESLDHREVLIGDDVWTITTVIE